MSSNHGTAVYCDFPEVCLREEFWRVYKHQFQIKHRSFQNKTTQHMESMLWHFSLEDSSSPKRLLSSPLLNLIHDQCLSAPNSASLSRTKIL